MDELDRRREPQVVLARVAAEPRRRERQQRPQPLAAGLDQMRGHLGDARGVLARHAVADQRVDRAPCRPASAACSVSIGVVDARAGVHRCWLSTSTGAVTRLRAMREILRTTDPTVIAFSTALLRGEDIDCFVLDVHMSVLEGSHRHLAAPADGRRPRRLPRPRRPARQRRRRPDAGMSFAARGPDLRRLPRRPRSGSGSRAAATAPPPTRCCSRPSSRPAPGERVLDLGCGAGTAALCLAARVPGLELHGLELQPAYAELARRNAAANGLALAVHEGDLRRPPAALRAPRLRPGARQPAVPPGRPPPRAADPGPRRAPTARARRRSPTGSTPACAGSRPAGRLRWSTAPTRLGAILAGLAGPRRGGRDPADRTARRPAGRARFCCGRARAARAPLTLRPPLTLHEGSSHIRDGDALY